MYWTAQRNYECGRRELYIRIKNGASEITNAPF